MQSISFRIIIFLFVLSFAKISDNLIVSKNHCEEYESRIEHQKLVICSSLSDKGSKCCELNQSLAEIPNKYGQDFPNQCLYITEILDMLLEASDCLDSVKLRDIVQWIALDQSDPDEGCSFMNQYRKFQIDYYKVPRPPGARLESPYTLGNKCWASIYMQDYWERKHKDIESTFQKHGLSLGRFEEVYIETIPIFYHACQMTINNCFRNVTWDPSYHGHCEMKIADFKVGYEIENTKHFKLLKDPFDF